MAVAETGGNHEVGFGKPPKHSRFIKGKSGNPKGRPKGSKNLATILEKYGRERITVTENGRSRNITKKEAIVLQLTNKSVSGDLKAIRDHLQLSQLYEAREQSASPVSHDGDKAVMASILERIRQSEGPTSEKQNNSEPANPKKED
jgi:hypothetical protein